MTFNEELVWRGFLNQTTYKNLSFLDDNRLTFYFGVDPSADSMTVGNLAAAMMVKCLIKYGHKSVLLVGGATGLIGDPDGKSQEREIIDQSKININKQAIALQYRQLFGDQDFQLVDNYDWFKDMNYLEFLRNIGKHVPMRQMMARDFVGKRLGENGPGISYAEFSYVLIQAYDFLHLYKEYGVSLQVCGSDQWGNSIAGVDLIRRVEGAEVNVLSTPLIIDESTGQKFGKSEAGAIWLDPQKTSPTEFYQFWVNVSDNSVEKYLKIFTEYEPAKISQIIEAHNQNLAARVAQSELAKAVTTLVHGKQAAIISEQITGILTGKTLLSNIKDKSIIDNLRLEIPSIKTQPKGEVAQALVDSKLAPSKTEARKLIVANAISINGHKTVEMNFKDEDFVDGRLIIRRGKAFKDSALVEVG